MQWNKTLQIFAAYLSHFTNVIMLLKPMAETFREKGWASDKSICCCSLKWLNWQAWKVPVLSLSKPTMLPADVCIFFFTAVLVCLQTALCYCHVNTFHPKYFFHNKEKAPLFLARVLVYLWEYEFHCKGSGEFFRQATEERVILQEEDGHYQNWYKQFNKLQACGDQVCGIGQPCCIYNTIFVLFLCYLLQDYWSKLLHMWWISFNLITLLSWFPAGLTGCCMGG